MSTLNPLLQLAAVVAQEVEEDKQLRCEEINSDVESDEEEEDSRILESLKPLNTVETNETVMLFTNFNFDELMQLWDITADAMIESWGGRGRQAKIGPFDAFYLLLYHYKRGKEPDAITKEFQPLWAPTKLSRHCVRNDLQFFFFFLLHHDADRFLFTVGPTGTHQGREDS
jgi:hypothetical protein